MKECYAARQARNLLNDLFMDEAHERQFPTIMDDLNLWDYVALAEYVCAVESVNQLKQWFGFGEVLNALFDAGYTVLEVEVDTFYLRYGKSEKQVAFKPKGIVSEKDLTLLVLVD